MVEMLKLIQQRLEDDLGPMPDVEVEPPSVSSNLYRRHSDERLVQAANSYCPCRGCVEEHRNITLELEHRAALDPRIRRSSSGRWYIAT